MDQVLALTLQSMHQDTARIERIGMNLANTLTPGYKREVALARPFGELVQADLARSAPTPAIDTLTDARPGTLKSTGHSLDVALAGDGYFEVSTAHGPAYTRQGNLQLDARGRLVTAHGDPVMGKGGEIVLNSPHPVIDAAGNISEAGAPPETRPLAQLKVVRFAQPGALERLGNGLVAGGAGMSVVGDADVTLRQGFLENSNVSSLHEMVQLMQTMRHFESMQKVAQGYDEMLGTAVRKLGDV